MDRPGKGRQPLDDERRAEVTAVEQQGGRLLAYLFHGFFEIPEVVVRVTDNGDPHELPFLFHVSCFMSNSFAGADVSRRAGELRMPRAAVDCR
jgi:hypothetical protein